MSDKRYFDKESRTMWYRIDNGGVPTVEDLTFGCLQRIATATETMAKDKDILERRLSCVQTEAHRLRNRCSQAERSNAALRGVITKLRKQLAEKDG